MSRKKGNQMVGIERKDEKRDKGVRSECKKRVEKNHILHIT